MIGKTTSADAKLLVKDTNGEFAHDNFRNSSVIGMLLYDHILHMLLTVLHAMCPRHFHELTLKRIGRNLKGTGSK